MSQTTTASSALSFSKKDTLVTKGVAIIMLVFYHCLSSKDRLCGYEVYLGPLPRRWAFYLFESMNICVGMFAFLSAYGLTKVAMKKYGESLLKGKAAANFFMSRIISLLGSFLIPYTVCTAATFMFTSYNPYGTGFDFAFNMTADMLGIAGLLNSKMMISTWWYMSFALIIILLIPVTLALYRKFGAGCLVPYLVIPVLIQGADFFASTGLTNMTRWLLTIPLGVIFAQGNTLERWRGFPSKGNKIVVKLIKFVILTAILVCLVYFRKTPWCQKHFYYIISSVLPVYFIYYLYEFLCPIPVVNTVFAFLGKHSSNIFFVHTFIRIVWWKDMTYSTGQWYWVFLIVFGISLAISIAITLFQKLVRWDKFIGFLSKKACLLTGRDKVGA